MNLILGNLYQSKAGLVTYLGIESDKIGYFKRFNIPDDFIRLDFSEIFEK